MRKLVVFIALAISLSSLGAVPTMYLRGAVEGSYLTNVFSDPLPINASESYLEDIEFVKRWNAGAALTFDTFFDDSYPAGLSFNAVFRFPITSETIYHDGSSYVSYDSLSSQRIGIFLGVGPVFRGRFGIVDIGLTLRASLGSYDYFVSGLIFGIEAEPFINVNVTEHFYISLGMKYDAHLMKFLNAESSNIYEDGFIMMTAGCFVGLGARFGGGDD